MRREIHPFGQLKALDDGHSHAYDEGNSFTTLQYREERRAFFTCGSYEPGASLKFPRSPLAMALKTFLSKFISRIGHDIYLYSLIVTTNMTIQVSKNHASKDSCRFSTLPF